MQSFRAILRSLVLALILYLGGVNLYTVIVQLHPPFSALLDWQFMASVLEGVLEVGLLVWFYRRIGGADPARLLERTTEA